MGVRCRGPRLRDSNMMGLGVTGADTACPGAGAQVYWAHMQGFRCRVKVQQIQVREPKYSGSKLVNPSQQAKVG